MAYLTDSRVKALALSSIGECLAFRWLGLAGLVFGLFASGGVVFAAPYLQLDATSAVWLDEPEESVFSTDYVFTLYALVNSTDPHAPAWPDIESKEYFISAALIPGVDETPAPVLGSFSFAGITIDVTGDMTYGAPPLDASTKDDLKPHGIFDTYYYELGFTLDPAKRTNVYNSQDTPGALGSDPVTVADGDLWYQGFEVDIGNLDPEYAIHFDLYTKDSLGNLEYFAPFSHDLITTHAPVPGAVLLGMLGLGIAGVKLRKYA